MRDDSSSGAIEHSLQAHSRAITDINFSAHHPDMLATCSVDGYAHCWDLRRPRQPALSFCDWFAGATQVKYNRRDPHILASSHDRWLHIWDDRNAAEPLKTISAHTSKIYGIDWNRARPTAVVTCSLDKSIKFWDYGNEDDVAERVIRTDFPVWRARHSPFGWGLLAMSQTEPGNLHLFDTRLTEEDPLDGYVDPVTVFPAHENHKAKEFLWRFRGTVGDDGVDNRDFQLVSWGEDNNLRLRRMDPADLEAVGYSKGGPARKNMSITRKGAIYKTFRTIDDGAHRDRRSATMSDQRPGTSGSHFPRSALTMSMQAPRHKSSSAWKGPSMTTRSAKDANRGHTQIGWMKGVSMTKRKSSSDSPRRGNSKDSSMFSPGFHDDDWSQPETVQEEIVRISTQMPNIHWDNVDMDSLSLTASLKGPWGVNGDAIIIKVRVDVPKSYPKLKSPRFYVEQSSFMPDDTYRRLGEELQELSAQFLSKKKGCLDVAFTYLLGEVDLETSTTFFKNVRDLDDDLDGLADDSSTDDDDDGDIPAGGSASMSQELAISIEPDTTLAPTLRPTLPPLRRSCGARFSNDGRLICFFPTKEEKARALQTTSTDAFKERPKGEPTFAGFGRLAHESPTSRHKHADEASATEDQSGESDGSDTSPSSTDSEITTVHKISLWYRPDRRFRTTWSAHDSVRSSGGGTGAGTGTGTGTSRRRPGKPRSVIAMHDVQDEIPAKKQFAEEYAIFGDGAEVCEHNAKVADKYGYQDLVDVWKYAALLLRSDIPLRLEDDHHQQRKSVLVIAREAVQHAKHDAGLLSGRVQWGQHPLAQDFIRDLFDYFERMADIQMLAMLSCIFGESSTEDSVAYAESHLTQPETPLPMKAPSFSLEYFPTNPELWNLQGRSLGSSSAATPQTAHTPLLYSDWHTLEDPLWAGDPGSNSYSCGETPPLKFGREHLAEAGQTQSLSTSPSSRPFRRVNSSMANTFTASLPRALTSLVSSSPPDAPPPPPPRKRPSPAETFLSNITSTNITWGASTVFGAAADPTTARTSVSDEDFRRREEFVVVGPPTVVVHTENERLFDDDGWMMMPLLEQSRDPIYANYRYAYSEMLLMWGQPLARLEIMKFNVLKVENSTSANTTFESGTAESSYHESYGPSDSNHSQPQPGATSPTMLLGGRREQLLSLRDSGRGLDVTGLCSRCEMQLEPLEYTEQDITVGGAAGTCRRCHRAQRQLRCVYCTEPVDALYPPCLGCGCASHEGCLAEWHAGGETMCPAGDECACVDEADNGTVETWQALRAQMARDLDRMREEQSRAKPRKGGGLPARARRRSVPARIAHLDLNGEGDEQGGGSRASLYGGDDDTRDKDDWESVASHSAAGRTLATRAGGPPSPLAGGHLSAARISLGNRLRPSALRRKSGGVMQNK